VALVLSAAHATSIQAAETVTGRWAADPSFCTRWFGAAAEQPLIVTEGALRWSADACRIERTYKTGDTVHIQALCWGEGGERSIPVSLRPHAGRLQVTWNRGARGELRRCP
jgi:hypothetical protein